MNKFFDSNNCRNIVITLYFSHYDNYVKQRHSGYESYIGSPFYGPAATPQAPGMVGCYPSGPAGYSFGNSHIPPWSLSAKAFPYHYYSSVSHHRRRYRVSFHPDTIRVLAKPVLYIARFPDTRLHLGKRGWQFPDSTTDFPSACCFFFFKLFVVLFLFLVWISNSLFQLYFK